MNIKRNILLELVGIVLFSLIPGRVFADDVVDLIKSVEQNYAAKKYKKALEDLEWVKGEIARLQLQEMKNLLPTEIDGMKGEDGDGGALFGLHSVSRDYRTNDGNKKVSINLMAAGESGGGLGALFGLAAAFGAMDTSKESKMITEKGYRGNFTLDPDNLEGTLMFNLSGGSMVQIQTFGYSDENMARKTAEKLDLPQIEDALK